MSRFRQISAQIRASHALHCPPAKYHLAIIIINGLRRKELCLLSLFGGKEEEDSHIVIDASAGDVKVKHIFTDKSNDNKQLKYENGSDDIIANLYGLILVPRKMGLMILCLCNNNNQWVN
ncbi:hypothetical protein LguiB_007105 [Lonicera macranthoides]